MYNRFSDTDIKNIREEDILAIKDLKKSLDPCIRVVYVESYRDIFKEIVKRWSEGREDSSYYYRFLEEDKIRNKRLLENILNTLVKCGYAIYKEGIGRESGKKGRKSPRKRKIYLPTPLGVALEKALTIFDLFDEALKNESIKERLITIDIYDGAVDEIIDEIINLPSRAYELTCYLYPQVLKYSFVKKGLYTLKYITLLIMTKDDILRGGLGDTDNELDHLSIEEREKILRKELDMILLNQEIIKNRINWLSEESVICKENFEYSEDVICKMLNHIRVMNDLLIKMINEKKNLS
jgi:hypothetical protein